MTSKEALKELVYYATLDDSGFERTMNEYADIIMQDLEILKLFKQKIIFVNMDGGIKFFPMMTLKENEKIKEWLKKEKKNNEI